MKKLYILALSALAISSVNAQTYLTKDFDDNSATSGGWTINEPTPATTTSLTWTTSTAGGAPTAYGMMKNYNGTGNEVVESWLISPTMDLSTSTTPTLSFINAYSYTGTALELMISTDYVSGAPSTGNWTAITSSATWSAGFFAWANSGNIDISAYNTTNVHIAYKYVGSATDGSTWEIDNVLVNETGAAPIAAVSVYDIQYTLAGNGNSPWMDSTVTTGGIVSAVRPDGRYYIQSGAGAWTGVYVYDNVNTVALGDSVTFQCVITEFNNLTELTSISNFTKVTISNTVVTNATTSGTAQTENYEGVLLQYPVINCTVATNGFGDWIINDGSGDCTVGSFMLATDYMAIVGGPYDVTGILDFAFGNYTLQPRMLADIVTSVGINETALLETSVYPNPANEFVNIEAPANSTVTILSIEGKVVINATTNNTVEMIDVSSLESGSYIVSISNNNAFSTQILIKK